MDELRLNAVYQLLENVIRYLPLRRPLRNFLVALRDWPIRMEFKKVTGQHYADKVSKYLSTYIRDVSNGSLLVLRYCVILLFSLPISKLIHL